MAFCDFVVRYDPTKDKPIDIAKRILYSIIIKNLKADKPRIIFMGGDSGEGKSFSAITLEDILLQMEGMTPEEVVSIIKDVNVFTPIEYPIKIKRIMGLDHTIDYSGAIKKANIICLHEAREVIKAKLWQTFLTQAIADINALSRKIKRLCVIINSQFIRDITPDMRYTLNYYVVARRPRGKPVRLYWSVMWKDDRDLDKPKLRKRKLSGYLIYPDGTRRHYVPMYFELKKPRKELVEIFDKEDYAAKAQILERKINKLHEEMIKEAGGDSPKVASMIEWYSTHTESLAMIGQRKAGKWQIKNDVKTMHNLSEGDLKVFEKGLYKELIKKGLLKEEEVKA